MGRLALGGAAGPADVRILDRREFVVGRGRLEPPSSAVTGPELCACDLAELDFDERCSRCYVVIPTAHISARLPTGFHISTRPRHADQSRLPALAP